MHGDVADLGNRFGVIREAREIAVGHAVELHVDQEQVHCRIAHPLTDPQAGRVDSIDPGMDRGDRIDNRQATVRMAVPVHFDTFSHVVDNLSYEGNEFFDTFRCNMAAGVGDDDTRRSGFNGGSIQSPEIFRPCPCCVLGHVGHRDVVFDRECYRIHGELQNVVKGPFLGILANRRRTDEGRRLDREAGFLDNLD
jgi:hypothetical protein